MPRKASSRTRTANLFRNAIKKSLERPEKLTVSQWAEKYRVLDQTSAFKGKWSNDITPYLIGIMDCFNEPYVQEINFCKPTQVGGTEALLNIVGWIITQNPSQAMIVYPTDDLAKRTVNDRLRPSLKKTPQIKEAFLEKKSSALRLKFNGMDLYLSGAGNANKLASTPIKFLLFDEIDKMPGASKKEASPYSLAKERTRSFTYTKKIYSCSTPTLNTNYVWTIHEAADEQRYYFVPCPHCGEEILLKWKYVVFENGEDKDGKQLTNAERAKTAKYYCQKCGCAIEDADKPAMLRKGIWRDLKKTCIGKPRKVSFHINALYSRFVRWEDAALEWLESKDDPEKLQNFINSWLAEPWENTKLKAEEKDLIARQTEIEQLVVPEWAKILTAGIDVQETCLYWTIRAWGNFITSQNIAHGQALSFEEIEKIMNFNYQKETGEKLIVNLALMDSGDQTDAVYNFCLVNLDWCKPCKGSSHTMMQHYKLSTVNKADSKAQGIPLYIVDGGKYKDMIAARMKKENGTGSWMIYKDCDGEYMKQITSEQKVMDKGTTYWKPKASHIDNHYLDAEVYAFAAADVLNVRMLYLEDEEEKQKFAPAQQKQQVPEENWIGSNESWL